MVDFALNFSRLAGAIVAQYYNFLRLGRKGYCKIHTACYQIAQYLAHEIENMGPFRVIYSGQMNQGIPAATAANGRRGHGVPSLRTVILCCASIG